MVGILGGKFVKFREPSDRVEDKGSYSLKPLHQDSRGCERRSRKTAKESNPSVRRRTCVARSPLSGIQTSEVIKGSPSTL
jgi:hypothetical protein